MCMFGLLVVGCMVLGDMECFFCYVFGFRVFVGKLCGIVV